MVLTYEHFGHAVAGAIAYVCSMTICYPLDTVRSILQVEDSQRSRNTFGLLKEIIYKNGIGALYQGLQPVLIAIFVSNFIYFYIYNGLKTVWTTWISTSIPASGYLIIAILAGIINVCCTNPLWVVNTRMRLQGTKVHSKIQKGNNDNFHGILDGIITIYKKEGIFGLWSGTLPSILLVSNPGIQFMTYEIQKKYIQMLFEISTFPAIIYFIMGANAKIMATFSTYPLQVIQTRLRFYNCETNSNLNSFKLLYQLIKLGGIKNLYHGMEAKLWQTVITSALMFAFYEKLLVLVFNFLNLELIVIKEEL